MSFSAKRSLANVAIFIMFAFGWVAMDALTSKEINIELASIMAFFLTWNIRDSQK